MLLLFCSIQSSCICFNYYNSVIDLTWIILVSEGLKSNCKICYCLIQYLPSTSIDWRGAFSESLRYKVDLLHNRIPCTALSFCVHLQPIKVLLINNADGIVCTDTFISWTTKYFISSKEIMAFSRRRKSISQVSFPRMCYFENTLKKSVFRFSTCKDFSNFFQARL